MCAVPKMAVFCISFTLWFPGMLLMYFLNDFELIPVAPIITGITLVFTFHMRCIAIVRFFFLLLLIFSFIFIGLQFNFIHFMFKMRSKNDVSEWPCLRAQWEVTHSDGPIGLSLS